MQQRNLGPGMPARAWSTGTLNIGRNAAKRKARAELQQLKHQPGGWKKGLRIWQEVGRMLRRGVNEQRARLNARRVPPHRSGGGQ